MRRRFLFLLMLPLLTVASLGSAQATPEAESPLSGTAWQWREFQSSNSTTVSPDQPQPDLIVFRPDGVLVVSTACAAGEGTWRETPDGLDLDLSGIDLDGCAEDSATGLLLRDLAMSTSFVVQDGDLWIALPMDGGIHQFVPSLAGMSWRWVQFQGSNDSLVTPKPADRYQVTFDPAGTVSVETPCASGEGAYRDTADGLTIDLSSIDADTCAEDSLASTLLADLNVATSYVVQDGHLWIALPMDAGIHEFAPVWPASGDD